MTRFAGPPRAHAGAVQARSAVRAGLDTSEDGTGISFFALLAVRSVHLFVSNRTMQVLTAASASRFTKKATWTRPCA
jgi:hypothetical protein